jgi:hypothetical protein
MRRILFAVALVAGAVFAREASAQQAVGSYQSSRPTLSPYLYLTRPNAGPFPNYQTFVQPLKAQQQTNQESQYQIGQLQQGQTQLQQEQKQVVPAQVSPTGVGSTFNSLSHYYPTTTGSATRSGGQRGKSPPRR